MRDGKMHQTTVRFGPDLWAALEEESGRLGMSAAQYVRESTLARLSYTLGRTRTGEDYERALEGAGAEPLERPTDAAQRAGAASDELALDVSAVAAQGRLARARSQEIRQHSADLRAGHRAPARVR
jgi:hypothetical protein